jgi:hypothetical protein
MCWKKYLLGLIGAILLLCSFISPANFALKNCDNLRAVNDTVVLKKGELYPIFHLAKNDIYGKGEMVCLQNVWGSEYISPYIGGSCDGVTIAPPKKFTGSFKAHYSVCCGNGVCDTAMIVVTVLK